MKVPDAGAGLAADRAFQTHSILYEESFAQATEESMRALLASARKAEPQIYHLHLPNPYVKVEVSSTSGKLPAKQTDAPKHDKEEKKEENKKEQNEPKTAKRDEEKVEKKEEAKAEKTDEKKAGKASEKTSEKTDPVEAKKTDSAQQKHQEEKPHDWFHDTCDWFSGAFDVATQVVIGAGEKVVEAFTEHPLETIGGIAFGVCIAAAAPAAVALELGAAVVAGITVVSDATIVGMTAMGAANAGVHVVEAVQNAGASADVLMHKSEHSEAEILAAREEVQNKTGQAALESAMTVAFMGPARTPFNRLMTRAGECVDDMKAAAAFADEEAMSASEAAMPAGAKAEGVSMNAGDLAGSAESRIKAAYEKVKSGISDQSSVKEQVVSPAAENAGEVSLGRFGTLPEATATKLMEQIDRVLADRQSMVDLESKIARYNELSKPYPEIMVGDSAGGTRPLDVDELFTPSKTIDRLEGTPQAEQYNRFLAELRERHDLRQRIEAELDRRRYLVERVINRHAKSLYPDGVVPNFRIISMAESKPSVAGYAQGDLLMKDSVFLKPSYLRKEGYASDLADSYIHEMKHGEQDGLMIRNFIDKITNGDTSGRSLTSSEIDAVLQMGKARIETKFPRELVEDINAKRAGRVLKQEEIARAEELEASEIARRRAFHRHADDSELYERLKASVGRIEGGDFPPDFFSAEYQDWLFKNMEIPEEFQKLNSAFKDLTLDEQVHLSHELKYKVYDALWEMKRVARARVTENLAEYKAWLHEQEAFDFGGQAAKQIAAREALAAKIFQEWSDAMAAKSAA